MLKLSRLNLMYDPGILLERVRNRAKKMGSQKLVSRSRFDFAIGSMILNLQPRGFVHGGVACVL